MFIDQARVAAPSNHPACSQASRQSQQLERLHLFELHQIVEQGVTQPLRCAAGDAVKLVAQLLGRERRLRAAEPGVEIAAKRATVLERDVEPGAPAFDRLTGRYLDRL